MEAEHTPRWAPGAITPLDEREMEHSQSGWWFYQDEATHLENAGRKATLAASAGPDSQAMPDFLIQWRGSF